MKLIKKIRFASNRRRNERHFIDLKPIRKVSAAGALVLAAELYRWNNLPGLPQLRDRDVSSWDPDVRRRLSEMGFFDLLNVARVESPSDAAIQFVKFRTGSKVEGEEIEQLRKLDLDPHVTVPNRQLLYAAVTEAMTNVVHHAYDASLHHYLGPRNWWLSAAFDSATGEVVILIYDQGLGIPKTLPRTMEEKLMSALPESIMRNDARMIQAAHELSRSTTGSKHRGHGLERDVRRYILEFEGHGSYTVFSGRGQYTVESSPTGTRSRLGDLGSELSGTLIEWRLTTK